MKRSSDLVELLSIANGSASRNNCVVESFDSISATLLIETVDHLDAWNGFAKDCRNQGFSKCYFAHDEDTDAEIYAESQEWRGLLHKKLFIDITKSVSDTQTPKYFTIDGLIKSLKSPADSKRLNNYSQICVHGIAKKYASFAHDYIPEPNTIEGLKVTNEPYILPQELVHLGNNADLPQYADSFILKDTIADDDYVGSILSVQLASVISVILGTEFIIVDGSSTVVLRSLSRSKNRIKINSTEEMSSDTAAAVHRSLSWMFDNSRDIDSKHAIVSGEIARLWPDNASWYEGLNQKLVQATELAKSAYHLHLADVASENIRSMNDLRKTLAEESSHLVRMTQELAKSLWRTLFLVVGTLVAHAVSLASAKGVSLHWLAIVSIIIIIIGFVSQTIADVFSIGSQRRSISKWKSEIYHMIPDKTYADLADEPLADAKRSYSILWGIILVCNIVSVGVLWAMARGCFDAYLTTK